MDGEPIDDELDYEIPVDDEDEADEAETGQAESPGMSL